MPLFSRYLGIDYSGAATPATRLPGLSVYSATPAQPPVEVRPPVGPGRHWTRRGLAEWLAATLDEGPPTLVGIDHAFSFPLPYFDAHRLAPDWPAFLADFHRHWPTDEDGVTVESVRRGRGAARPGNARWRRLTERRCRAKSVFHFDVPGSVAKSTHAGLPWLLRLRRQLGPRVHVWPFDGWTPPAGRSVVAEVYPALWQRNLPAGNRTPHQHDAWSVARWLRHADADATLAAHFHPPLAPAERTVAAVEGWILGLG